MDACTFHPEHAAAEYCEVCAEPLCGLCLWYTSAGHRLCRRHAREQAEAGQQVLPPQTYHEAIEPSLLSDQPDGGEDPAGIYQGNSIDLSGLLAAVVGLTTLFSCFGGVYCLPLFVLLLGGAAYFNASTAVDAKRTRRLALIGLAVVALMGVVMLAFILFYVALVVFLMATGSGP